MARPIGQKGCGVERYRFYYTEGLKANKKINTIIVDYQKEKR